MDKRICPECKKEVGEFDTVCPNCGIMLFDEPVDYEKIPEEYESESEEEDDSIITYTVMKIWGLCMTGLMQANTCIKSGIHWIIDKSKKYVKIAWKYIMKYSKKAWEAIKKYSVIFAKKVHLDRLVPYITYQNVLSCITIIAVIVLVSMGVKMVIYKDHSYKVDTTSVTNIYRAIEERHGKEGERLLDIKNGYVLLRYEDEKVGGVKVDLDYRISPKTNNVIGLFMQFDNNIISVNKMRDYLEINYGKPVKKSSDGTWNYSGDDVAYSFTNGTSEDTEVVEIFYLKEQEEAAAAEDTKEKTYESDNENDNEKDNVEDNSEDKEDNTDKKNKSEQKDSKKQKDESKQKDSTDKKDESKSK